MAKRIKLTIPYWVRDLSSQLEGLFPEEHLGVPRTASFQKTGVPKGGEDGPGWPARAVIHFPGHHFDLSLTYGVDPMFGTWYNLLTAHCTFNFRVGGAERARQCMSKLHESAGPIQWKFGKENCEDTKLRFALARSALRRLERLSMGRFDVPRQRVVCGSDHPLTRRRDA